MFNDVQQPRHAQLFELLRQKALADQITKRVTLSQDRTPSRGDTTLIKSQAMRSLNPPRVDGMFA